MRLNAAPMAAASVPASCGSTASKRPDSTTLSACTIWLNGRTARFTSQNTVAFTATSATSAQPASASMLSQASISAREALAVTTSLPSGNSIACTEGSGAISAANQSGASRPAL